MTGGALCNRAGQAEAAEPRKSPQSRGGRDSAPVPTTFNERTPEAAIADAIPGGNVHGTWTPSTDVV